MISNECSVVIRYNIGLNHILTGIKDIPEKVIDSIYGDMGCQIASKSFYTTL